MSNQKELRRGFTTGSCSAAAAKAAAVLLLTNEKLKTSDIPLPNGQRLCLAVAAWKLNDNTAHCAIVKDSGDDPDVTNGALICADVRTIPKGIIIDGGQGVGRVTKKGLDQPVGYAAINRVPREMIARAVKEAMEYADYTGGLLVCISIPRGEELARKTFNEKLGIVGGLSILGTSGIVEPMSEKALLDSIRLEINMKLANGCKFLALTPGNYGQAFLNDSLAISLSKAVKISNFIGDSLHTASEAFLESSLETSLESSLKSSFKSSLKSSLNGILLVGHIGKLVKLAGGISQTHSRYADCRLELLTAHSALCGASLHCIKELMEATTSERAVEILKEEGILAAVMASLLPKIEETMSTFCGSNLEFGVVVFSSRQGLLMQSKNAVYLAEKIRLEE